MDADLLDLALTHRSFAYENGQILTNERLSSSRLGARRDSHRAPYRTYPDLAEGQLEVARQGRQRGQPGRSRPEARHWPAGQAGRGEISTGERTRRPSWPTPWKRSWGRPTCPAARPALSGWCTTFVPLIDHAATYAGLDWKTRCRRWRPPSGCPPRSTRSPSPGPTTTSGSTPAVLG